MRQAKRMAMYDQYCKHSESVLLATDIAARGLDFPGVDWVIQLDCPENVESYVHRVGRTARYRSAGNALLLLLPSEVAFAEKLAESKVGNVKKIKVSQKLVVSTRSQFASILASDTDVKHLAQKAFKSYLRSVYVQKDKSVFKVEEIVVDELALAMGFSSTPKVKFLKPSKTQSEGLQSKNIYGYKPTEEAFSSEDDREVRQIVGSDDDAALPHEIRKEIPRSTGMEDDGSGSVEEESEEEFLNVKKVIAPSESDDEEEDLSLKNVRPPKRQKIGRDGTSRNTGKKRIVFDEDGEELGSDEEIGDPAMVNPVEWVDRVQSLMKSRDEEDKKIQKEKIREKRKIIKDKMRAERPVVTGPEVTLASADDSESEQSESSGEDDSAPDDDDQELALKILEARGV